MTDRAFPPSVEPGLTPPDLRPDEVAPDGGVRDEADGEGGADATSISRAALAAEPEGPLLGRRQWPLPKQADPNAPLLVVENLKTHFALESGTVRAVDGVSFSLGYGEALGIAGEFGLRQDDDRAVARPDPAVERDHRRGQHQADGDRSRPQDREPAATLSLARDQHRLPGRDERAQPGPPRPRPDRRADRGPSRSVAQGGPQASRRAARAGRHPAQARPGRTRTSCRAGCASAR